MSGFDRLSRRKTANSVFVGFCWVATAVALAALAVILWSLVQKGFGGLNLDVFTQDQPAAGSHGGLRNAITGSIILCLGAMVIAMIVGVLAGTWLAEYGGETRYGQVVRFVNDVLLSAPSILVGLFVWEILVAPFHGYSAIAGAVALAFLAAPVVTRTTEDILRLQPQTLREAGVALGTPRWTTIRKVIWRAAGAGMLTGGLLAFARISGETAPLLFTTPGRPYNSVDLAHPLQTLANLTQPIGSLPTVIYQFANGAYDDLRDLAWVGALLIAVAVLSINIIGRVIAARGQDRS
jgi:phosphate transport system permease protein